MEPTLRPGDWVLVSSGPLHEPRRGEIVVFKSEVKNGENLIKRVVAVGGDTVEVRDGSLYVNGQSQDEKYLLEPTIRGSYPKTVIAKGFLFLMGDNRNNSEDSRIFGPVSEKAVIGQALILFWPFWHLRSL